MISKLRDKVKNYTMNTILVVQLHNAFLTILMLAYVSTHGYIVDYMYVPE